MTSQDANSKKAAVASEQRRQRATNIVPMLVVAFALLSALVLFVLDRDSGSPAPQPNYRADAPPAPPSRP